MTLEIEETLRACVDEARIASRNAVGWGRLETDGFRFDEDSKNYVITMERERLKDGKLFCVSIMESPRMLADAHLAADMVRYDLTRALAEFDKLATDEG